MNGGGLWNLRATTFPIILAASLFGLHQFQSIPIFKMVHFGFWVI
jgi:hypothetical protein